MRVYHDRDTLVESSRHSSTSEKPKDGLKFQMQAEAERWNRNYWEVLHSQSQN